MKEKLERIQVDEEDSVFESLQEMLRSIDREELNRVFHAWMRRGQEISQGNGDYVK
jgi:hypothetical protein